MTQIQSHKKEQVKVRLKFIDMARSIAILLMLEGHFVDDSLAVIYRDPNHPVFATWQYIRGFTAPVFLTVTGLIFVYLLLKNPEIRPFKNVRFKKGFKRVVELFFWGYLVQYYAFHVLECIASGIFLILMIYLLYRLIKFIPLWIYFFAAGFTIFAFYLFMRTLPEGMPWPENAWYYVQNAFHGPGNRAIFPIVPWVGFTMFGAMIGALLHDVHHRIRSWYFPLIVFSIGFSFYWFPKEILGGLDSLINVFSPGFGHHFVYLDWLYWKFGMVLIELSVLIFIDNMWGNRIKDNSLFLKVGQNTLTIYVLHMVVLYGSMTSIGLNDFFHKNLNPYQVAIGAACFIAFFVILIKYLDRIKARLEFILGPIRKFFNRLFSVSS